nr:MAG TPA: hypothetical protein [Caudoviricetes sp.]
MTWTCGPSTRTWSRSTSPTSSSSSSGTRTSSAEGTSSSVSPRTVRSCPTTPSAGT